MENSIEKSVKLPVFKGEQSKFQLWWIKFMSYANLHKFRQALTEDVEADLPTKESDYETLTNSDPDKKKKAAYYRNMMAMANLTMAFENEALMGMVYNAMTAEYPTIGLAHIVVKQLMKKYRPSDTMTRVELRQELNKIKMKDNQNPSILFESISSIKNRFNGNTTCKVEDIDLVAVVLDAAPASYKAVLTAEQCFRGNALKLEDLEAAINQHLRQI